MYRVSTGDGSPPTGIFDIELTTALALTLVVFDIVSLPSQPKIEVRASANGVRYQDADQISRNGYRINAWLPTESVRFLRIEITPTHPDTLGGNGFIFGLTNFSASAVDFHLRSELTSRLVSIRPRSSQLRFAADADRRINYFLSFDETSFSEIAPGALIDVPGAAVHYYSDVTVTSTGLLGHTLSPGLYPSTLRITNAVNGEPYRIAYGLPQGSAALLSNRYICVQSTGVNWDALHLRPFTTPADDARTFNISYMTGPASLNGMLRVRLSTEDRSVTPVLRGAFLENS